MSKGRNARIKACRAVAIAIGAVGAMMALMGCVQAQDSPSQPTWLAKGIKAGLHSADSDLSGQTLLFSVTNGWLGDWVASASADVVKLLTHSRADVRFAAIRTLDRFGASRAGDIAPLLADPDFRVQLAAIEALVRLRNTEHIRDIEPLVSSPLNSRVAETATRALVLLDSNKHITDFLATRGADQWVIAVGALSKTQVKARLQSVVVGLDSANPTAQIAAMTALRKLDTWEVSKYADQIAVLARSTYAEVRGAAIVTLGRMSGGVARLLQMPSWIDPSLAAAIDDVLAHSSAKSADELFARLLASNDPRVLSMTINALGAKGRKSYTEAIAACLSQIRDPEVQAAAIQALVEFRDIGHLDAIRALSDPGNDDGVRAKAIDALAYLQPDARTRADAAAFLGQGDDDVKAQVAAIRVLKELKATEYQYLDRIAQRATEDPNSQVRIEAIKSLAALGPVKYADIIAGRIEDDEADVRAMAIELIATMKADAYAQRVEERISDDPEPQVRIIARRALVALNPSLGTIRNMAQSLTKDIDNKERDGIAQLMVSTGRHEFPVALDILAVAAVERAGPRYAGRALVPIVTGGEPSIVPLWHWLGNAPEKIRLDALGIYRRSPTERKSSLDALLKAWPSVEGHPRLRAEALEAFARIVEACNAAADDDPARSRGRNAIDSIVDLVVGATCWDAQDMKLLMDVRQIAPQGATRLLAALQSASHHPELRNWIRDLLVLVVYLLGVPSALLLVVWPLILCAYPHSPFARELVLTFKTLLLSDFVISRLASSDFLRRPLLAHAAPSLREDAILDDYDERRYFSTVRARGKGKVAPLTTLIPQVSGRIGRILLVGDPGFGKSLFLRRLVKNSVRPTVFLSASKCNHGVVEAIKEKLQDLPPNNHFVQNLLRHDGLDVVIDRLNEATSDTRSRIWSFVDAYKQVDLIIAAQPTEPDVPAELDRIELQPLDQTETRLFLLSRAATLPPDSTISGTQFAGKANAFLDEAFGLADHDGRAAEFRAALSNPMDLEMVAQILAQGKTPDLLHLQQQIFDLIDSEYRKRFGSPFPIEPFAEAVYAHLSRGTETFSPDGFPDAVKILERYKILLPRHGVAWRFRHDKARDFFAHRASSAKPPGAAN